MLVIKCSREDLSEHDMQQQVEQHRMQAQRKMSMRGGIMIQMPRVGLMRGGGGMDLLHCSAAEPVITPLPPPSVDFLDTPFRTSMRELVMDCS